MALASDSKSSATRRKGGYLPTSDKTDGERSFSVEWKTESTLHGAHGLRVHLELSDLCGKDQRGSKGELAGRDSEMEETRGAGSPFGSDRASL